MGDTEDWKDKDADIVTQRIVDLAKPGRIMLMHDLYDTTTQAVARAIPTLKNQGYTFVTIPELLQIRGLENTEGTIIF
jgi:peptidoglycan/xylan/chitin deacetylase (PgdA/CDA1 family)